MLLPTIKPYKQRLSSMLKQQKTEKPAGAGKKEALRVVFDRRLKLEFHGSKVTSDAGLLAYRELDAALGLTDLGDELLNDWRTACNGPFGCTCCHPLFCFNQFGDVEQSRL